MRAPRSRALPLALAAYLLLAVLTVREFGVAGEVAAGWASGPPPRVALDLDGPVWSGPPWTPGAGHAWGPLVTRQTRPVETLEVGPVRLPLALNQYTGGVADWPARLLHAATGSVGVVVGLHVALGALLIVLVHRFVRIHGSPVAAGLAALLLGTSWPFLFYRKALGGTEVLLLAGALLVLWALWSRRWRGGRHGDLAIALGLGLGFLAKVTFAATAGAFALAALATRWDRPSLQAPPPIRWLRDGAVAAACLVPLVVAVVHAALGLPASPRIVSHDGWMFQVERLGRGLGSVLDGGFAPAREGMTNLVWFLVDPLRWFVPALGADPPGWSPWPLYAAGWALVAWGAARAWRRRDPVPQDALLRFVSIAAPCQLGFLFLLNRDLHHLAQAAPTLAILGALALDSAAAGVAAPRTRARAAWAAAFSLAWVAAGVSSLVATDSVLATVRAPVITHGGQAAIVDLLRGAGVRRVWTSEYDVYGVLEVLAPEVEARHAWGAVSRSGDRNTLLARILADAAGTGEEPGHYLALRPAARRIYDLFPSEETVQRAAAAAGVRVERAGSASDREGDWAVLWCVTPGP